jgi:hypothetical protein
MKPLFLTLFFFFLAQSGSALRQQAAPGHTNDILEVKFSPDASKQMNITPCDALPLARTRI